MVPHLVYDVVLDAHRTRRSDLAVGTIEAARAIEKRFRGTALDFVFLCVFGYPDFLVVRYHLGEYLQLIFTVAVEKFFFLTTLSSLI